MSFLLENSETVLLREAEHAKSRKHVLNGRGPNDHCCEALVTHLLSTEAEVFNQTLLFVSYLLGSTADLPQRGWHSCQWSLPYPGGQQHIAGLIRLLMTS
jgi:hypothetical protein